MLEFSSKNHSYWCKSSSLLQYMKGSSNSMTYVLLSLAWKGQTLWNPKQMIINLSDDMPRYKNAGQGSPAFSIKNLKCK